MTTQTRSIHLFFALTLLVAAGCGEDAPPAAEGNICDRFPDHPDCATEGEGEGEAVGTDEGTADTPEGPEGEEGADEGPTGEEDEGEAGEEGEMEGGEEDCDDDAGLSVAGSSLTAESIEAQFQSVSVDGQHQIDTGCLGWIELQASAGTCLLTVTWPGGDTPVAGESYGPKNVAVTYTAGEGCPGGDAGGDREWFGGDDLVVEVIRWEAPTTLPIADPSCIAGLDIKVELTGSLTGTEGDSLDIEEATLVVTGDASSNAAALALGCAANICGDNPDCLKGQWCDNSEDEVPSVCLPGCRIGDQASCIGREYCDDDHVCRIGCDADEDCDGGQTCNVPNHQCTGAACGSDADCGAREPFPDSQFCDLGAAVPVCTQGCRDSDDCAGAQPCLPDTRVCGCGGDADCGDGLVCSHRECVAPCAGDDGCAQGEYCEDGHCFAGCRVDEFEPNDARGDCRALPADGGAWDLALCGDDNDSDWLCVSLEAGDTVTVTLTFDADDPDLDLELWTADDVRVGQENAPGGGREVLVYGPVAPNQAGAFRLGIIPDDFEDTDYHLEVDIEAGEGCRPDELEDDGNDTRGTAESIDGGGRWEDLTICNGGEDWYSVGLRAGDGLSVNLDFEGDDGWLLAQIWHPNANLGQFLTESLNDRLDDSATAVLPGEDVLADGDYLIRIYSPDQLGPIHYSMEVRVLLGELECVPDEHEAGGGNEVRADSAQIGPGVLRNLSLCADDSDWYQVNVPQGDELIVTSDRFPDGRDHNHQLELFGSDGRSLRFSAQAGPTNRASTEEASGVTYIQIRHPQGHGDEEIAYTLTVRVVDTPDGCQADDELENNDSRQTATQLGELLMFPEVNSYEDLISCPDDEDWYELDLRGVQIDNLQFSITFSHAGGDLDMFLQGDDGRTPCARPANCTSDSEDDNESIETGALPPGIYYLNVEGFDDDANDYDMDITVTPYICDDDLLSGNQSRDDAVSANLADDSWSREDLTICKGDSDWFAVDVDAGDDLKVALDFLAVQGDDLSLKIYEPGSNQAVVNVISANPPRVQGLLALQNSECVKVDDAGGGIYMIEVYGTGRESSYDIDIDSAAGLGDCPVPD